jgi:dCMP deaminase
MEIETQSKICKWHDRWFQLVETVSQWSYDPSTKVGALILPQNSDVPILGWNGFPRKVKDLKERYENRQLKYDLVVHAEMNAILNATRHGINIQNGTLYVSFFPCQNCAKCIAQAGIKKIFYKKSDEQFLERWKDSINISKLIFEESSVKTYCFD